MVKKIELTTCQKLRQSIKKNIISISIIGVMLLLIVFTIIGSVMSQERKSELENKVYGDDVVVMTYFHLSTCPHCHKQSAYHKVLLYKYPQLKIEQFELSTQQSQDKFLEIAENFIELDANRPSTPTTIIGNRVNVGYGSDETTGKLLEEMILEEIQRIEASWDENTMIRTIDLNNQ